ncbi:MAG: tetratricopeptide repeat protein, partial [Nitrospirota bacterium]
IGQTLERIGNGTYSNGSAESSREWDAFIHYFRYRYDNGATGRIVEVIDRLTEEIMERKNTAKMLNQQGEEHFIKGDMVKAREAFARAIEADSGFVVPYNNLGVMFWQAGDADSALKNFAAALRTDPYDQNTALNYGAVLASMRQFDEAVRIYNAYLQARPDDRDVALALMDLEAKKGAVSVCERDADSGVMPVQMEVAQISRVPEKEILKHTNRVSFELSNLCNYAGIHRKCPLHHISGPVILPSRIVRDVTDTLAEDNFKGTIAFHTYNEPLIDPRLFTFIHYARKTCPESHIYICTNGYYFNEILGQEMTEAGVSEIHISAYSQSEYNRLQSIKLEIPYSVEIMILDDRLGLYDRDENSMREPCFAPLNEIIIGREGVISLCCLDWRRDYSFGDLRSQSFKDVLRSGALHAVYERLSRGDRFLPICRRCGWVR